MSDDPGYLSHEFRKLTNQTSPVPSDVEHIVVWTKLPIIHPSLVDPRIKDVVNQIGLTGCTGLDGPPPSLADELPGALPALAAWKITEDDAKLMPNAEKLTPEERALMKEAGREVEQFILERWKEDEWETCWFVNPPVSWLGVRSEFV